MTLLTDDELRRGLITATSSGKSADDFFGGFPYVQKVVGGNYLAAFEEGFALLHHCQEVDAQTYERIHKGTAFYWLGTAAFHLHDYESAVFFYDAAVSEDLRIGADPIYNSTPALRFIQIEGDQPAQAARHLVQQTQTRVERAIVDYNSRSGGVLGLLALELTEVRAGFLRRAVSQNGDRLRTLATAFISYFLEQDYLSALTRLRPGTGTAEPFFLHLFKGCLLFESLLKANPRKTSASRAPTLEKLLPHLESELGMRVNISGAKLQTLVGNATSADESTPNAVEYTGKLRNTLGHSLGWNVALDPAPYDNLAAKVGAACLHAIACLYR